MFRMVSLCSVQVDISMTKEGFDYADMRRAFFGQKLQTVWRATLFPLRAIREPEERRRS